MGYFSIFTPVNAETERIMVEQRKQGEVILAGAGPGDPDLLTVAVLREMSRADVILHDTLVSPEVLALAGPQARLIETGKTGFGPSMKQENISEMIVFFAQRGYRVLRLKSGDPGLFGRLGEELDALDAAGIAWRVLPGITAASAAADGLSGDVVILIFM
jgi:uroporphyrin-III C-methyltransferase